MKNPKLILAMVCCTLAFVIGYDLGASRAPKYDVINLVQPPNLLQHSDIERL